MKNIRKVRRITDNELVDLDLALAGPSRGRSRFDELGSFRLLDTKLMSVAGPGATVQPS